MASSTTNLDTISESQAGKATAANELIDALSPASLFGRRASTCAGLTWGYYGGPMLVDGVLTSVSNGTVVLGASDTVYVEATRAGAVSQNGTGFTPGSIPLYTVVTGASTVTSYTDHRPWAMLPGVNSRLSKSVAGGSNVTLTAQEAICQALNFTGALSANISVIVPNGPQIWAVTNNTTGAYTLTIKTSAGTGVVISNAQTGIVLADGTNVVLATASGSGLSNFTETLTTSSPNATVPVVSLAPNNGASAVDLAVMSKAGGSILRWIPDNTSTGGNKRGSYAVDFGTPGTAATQVASGLYAVISGGLRNTASGSYSAIGGGLDCDATGTNATVAGGDNCNATANYAAVGGGDNNDASAVGACVPGGTRNTANGVNSIATGERATARALRGAQAHAASYIASPGDAQTLDMVLFKQTTNNTQTALTAAGGAAGTDNQLVLPNSSACVVVGEVVGRQPSTGDTIAWKFEGVIRRGANAAATAMVAAATVTQIAADAGASTWALAVDADTTNGCLRIRVTGETSKTINWTGRVRSTQTVG